MTDTAMTARRLLRTPGPDLDDLYRRSPTGRIPAGDSNGSFIIAPGSPFAGAAAGIVRLTVWKGKIFDSGAGALRNKVGPLGTPAVAAKVAYGPSRFDGRRSIIIDYSRTSRVARCIRDEIREVAPGVFLGMAYWNRHRFLRFVLDLTRPG
jgi:hypothetical protein